MHLARLAVAILAIGCSGSNPVPSKTGVSCERPAWTIDASRDVAPESISPHPEYLLVRRHTFQAVNADGSVRWEWNPRSGQTTTDLRPAISPLLQLLVADGTVEITGRIERIVLDASDGALIARHRYGGAAPTWQLEQMTIGAVGAFADLDSVTLHGYRRQGAELYSCEDGAVGRVVTPSGLVLKVGPHNAAREQVVENHRAAVGYFLSEDRTLRAVRAERGRLFAEGRCWDLPEAHEPSIEAAVTRHGIGVHQRISQGRFGPVSFLAFGEERDVAACRRVGFRVIPPVQVDQPE